VAKLVPGGARRGWWCQVVQGGTRWYHAVTGGSVCCHAGSYGARCFLTFPYGFLWCHMGGRGMCGSVFEMWVTIPLYHEVCQIVTFCQLINDNKNHVMMLGSRDWERSSKIHSDCVPICHDCPAQLNILIQSG